MVAAPDVDDVLGLAPGDGQDLLAIAEDLDGRGFFFLKVSLFVFVRLRAGEREEEGERGVSRGGARKGERKRLEEVSTTATTTAASFALHDLIHSTSFSSQNQFLFTFDSALYLGWMSFFIATTWSEPRRCEW